MTDCTRLDHLSSCYGALLSLVEQRFGDVRAPQPVEPPGFLKSLGQRTWIYVEQIVGLLGFIGEAFVAMLGSLRDPFRIRWHALLGNIEQAGVRAIPIVSLLSFLLGIVIAYQGGIQLRAYGANIFIVELVSLTMCRELAPMMAAIIVAGRSGSAYTAEIGTMKVTEEIDALRTLGMAPMEILVLPKVLGLLVALPLLTVVADSVGRQTTVCVVQAIFWVIVVDAAFSVLFGALGI